MRLSYRRFAALLILMPTAMAMTACDSKTDTPAAPANTSTSSAPAPTPTSPAVPEVMTPAPDSSAMNTPAIGTQAWFKWVETAAGITDGQGHGPDHGSQEWCDAVSFKVYEQAPTTAVSCDQVWMTDIDARLRARQAQP